MTRHVLVRPLDWVAFGPPRSAFAGESHNRGSQLPSPTSFQGLLRSAFLVANGDDLVDRSQVTQRARDRLVGGPDALPDGWQFGGPFLYEVSGIQGATFTAAPWVRVPRFLLSSLHDAPPKRLAPRQALATAMNDLVTERQGLVLAPPRAAENTPSDGWLSPSGLRWALAGDLEWRPEFHSDPLPPFVKRQRIPGLQIDADTGAAKDGMLYSAEVLRFAYPHGFGGFIQGVPEDLVAKLLDEPTLGAAGWKSRPVEIFEARRIHPDFTYILEGKHLPRAVNVGDSYYLVALTPVRLTDKDTPTGCIENRLKEHLPSGVTVQVLSAATGRCEVHGGLRAASREVRPNRSYLPAGSVWLFRLAGPDDSPAAAQLRAEALRGLNNAHLLGDRGETSFGFGHTVVGLGPTTGKENEE